MTFALSHLLSTCSPPSAPNFPEEAPNYIGQSSAHPILPMAITFRGRFVELPLLIGETNSSFLFHGPGKGLFPFVRQEQCPSSEIIPVLSSLVPFSQKWPLSLRLFVLSLYPLPDLETSCFLSCAKSAQLPQDECSVAALSPS